MNPTTRIRPATLEDLPAINRVIEAAVMTWDLPERVKRLTLPSYRYNEHDFAHLQMAVAEDAAGQVTGVASWEPANAGDCPAQARGMLLHGLYVMPGSWGSGHGSRLLDHALKAAAAAGMDGLLVKAQADAVGFFSRCGMQPLAVEDATRHYSHRFWKSAITH
jgi:N-acetylglutamate synthase-like GNAT family acetyltransferase